MYMFNEKEVHIILDILRNKYKNLIITFVKNDFDFLRLSIFTNYIPINYIIEKVETILSLDKKISAYPHNIYSICNKEFIVKYENNYNYCHPVLLIYRNPSIFTYDYNALKNRMKNTIAEDLMKNRFHPKHMSKWYGWGQIDEEDLELGVFD